MRVLAGRWAPLFTALWLVAVPCWGASPIAKLTGPASVPAGQLFILDFAGSISDKDVKLKVAGPSSPPVVKNGYSKDGRLNYVVVQPMAGGTYYFMLGAAGIPSPGADAEFDEAFLVVNVGGPAPTPTPTPPPSPTPPPPPPPGPTPQNPGVAIGQAYTPVLMESNAAAWDVYADSIFAGKTLSQAQVDYQAKWKGSLQAWLDANVTAAFTAILPDLGAQPTAAQRTAIVALARGIAAGERGGSR